MKNPFLNISYESDKDTINPEYDELSVRYHYNFIENAIIQNLPSCKTVLDIGPGYGHFIEFFQKIYNAQVEVLDISPHVVLDLMDRYNVTGFNFQIENFPFGYKYDVINVIGVLHHIIDNKEWIKAISNITKMVSDGGYIFIGTKVDFIKPVTEGYKKLRTLSEWRTALAPLDVSIIRSDPPWHCRKHLDLIVVKA